ncbi:hypothetical protein TNCV_2169621 [Trichonephila clavipes]|nr:hypothetical protein TNCV_2169621 [Trichonephila clavipes]
MNCPTNGVLAICGGVLSKKLVVCLLPSRVRHVRSQALPGMDEEREELFVIVEVFTGKERLEIDEAHFWLNGYVNKQNCRIWSEANPQVYVETPLHPEKLTVWCALWAGGILLQNQ